MYVYVLKSRKIKCVPNSFSFTHIGTSFCYCFLISVKSILGLLNRLKYLVILLTVVIIRSRGTPYVVRRKIMSHHLPVSVLQDPSTFVVLPATHVGGVSS